MESLVTSTSRLVLASVVAMGLAGCGASDGDDDTPTPAASQLPDTYSFVSEGGQSTVSYTGQIFRHVLIHDLKAHMGELAARIDDGSFAPSGGDVVSELNFFYEFDSTIAGTLAQGISTDPAPLQTTYDDISSGKDLRGKLAGNDSVGQYKDWSTEFQGWTFTDAGSPDELVYSWFQMVDELAVMRAAGEVSLDPTGAPISAVYVTAAGQDLQQLIQKFLDGAISYSQGTDDYLDDDVEGKGLLSSNAVEEGEAFSELAHAWDEGFGYFGASRDYGSYTDEEIAAKGGRDGWSEGYHDSDDDGFIDLGSEYNFGHSLNAAKRDLGAPVATNMTQQVFDAFIAGRSIIHQAGAELTDAELNDLKAQRDLAVAAWEAAIAATVVHYINETLGDMAAFGTDDYDFASHAKHWSELKGFALALQFNPRSSLSDSQFGTLHEALGDAPVLPGQGGEEAYRDALLSVRETIQSSYGFDPANMGDSAGEGGW